MKALLVAVTLLLLFLAPTATAAPGPVPEPTGKDIFLPETMHCIWKGSHKPVVDTPLVTVWVYTCDSPDT